jgi:hypothetical protein
MWMVRSGVIVILVSSVVFSICLGIAHLADASAGFPMELIIARNDGYIKALPLADGVLRTLDLCLILIPASLGVYYSVDSLRETMNRKTTDRIGAQKCSL